MCYLEVSRLISTYLRIFPFTFLVLIFSLIPLWPESRHCINSNSFHLIKCVLWPRMWSVLVSAPCDLEKTVYPAVVGWMKQSVDVCNCIQLIEGIVEFSCVLIDFLPNGSVHF